MKIFAQLGVIFVLEVDLIYAATRHSKYSPLSKFLGKRCKDEDMVFEYRGRDSALSCSAICAAREDCYGVFYTQKTKACVGCGMYYPIGSNMEEGDPDTQPLYSCADKKDWEYHDGSYYKLFDLYDYQPRAKTFCLKQCSDLVRATTRSEIVYVRQLTKSSGGSGFWLGMEYDVVEKVWKWDDNRSLVTEFNWGRGEPSKPKVEQCVIVSKIHEYRWADYNCWWASGVMCEME